MNDGSFDRSKRGSQDQWTKDNRDDIKIIKLKKCFKSYNEPETYCLLSTVLVLS